MARPRNPQIAQRLEEWPPFFDGRLRMQIVMATATWGPMRVGEIARLTGETARGNRRWNTAASYLEQLGVLVRQKRHQTHLVVGFDRRHPAHHEIQQFGKALYALYIAPLAPWTPPRRRNPLPTAGPKYQPADLDLHVLGKKARAQILHFLFEARRCRGVVLRQSLDLSPAGVYESVAEWERFGVLARRHPSPIWHQNKWDVHFDRAWPAFYALQRLLERLNAHLPQYAELADAYKEERDKGHHTRKWLIAQTLRYKRDNAQIAKRVKPRLRRNEDDGAGA